MKTLTATQATTLIGRAVDGFVARSEARDMLVSKLDLKTEFQSHTRWLVGVFIVIAFGQMAVTIGLMPMMMNFYLGNA